MTALHAACDTQDNEVMTLHTVYEDLSQRYDAALAKVDELLSTVAMTHQALAIQTEQVEQLEHALHDAHTAAQEQAQQLEGCEHTLWAERAMHAEETQELQMELAQVCAEGNQLQHTHSRTHHSSSPSHTCWIGLWCA